MTEILLITACINPNTSIKLQVSSPEVRLNAYKNSLNFWIESSNFDHIVFCENSNYDYSFEDFKKLAQKHGKELEVLRFQASPEGKSYGKGYSEGEIILFAFQNSLLMRKCEKFYKVTGMRIVKNINNIIAKHSNLETCFNLAAPFADMVDTRFFKCSKSFFQKHLLYSYINVRDNEFIFMEHLYLRILKTLKNINSFSIYPHIIGTSGSMGTAEEKPYVQRTIRQFLTSMGFYRI